MPEIAIPPPAQLNSVSLAINHQMVWEEWMETMGMYFMVMNIKETKQKKLFFGGGRLEIRKKHKTLDDENETCGNSGSF